MPSQYPGNLDALPTTRITGNVIPASDHNDTADAVNKIEAELGTNPKGSSATVKARLDSDTANINVIKEAPLNVKNPPGSLVAAKGDGTTDDRAALQACINAAITAGDAGAVARMGKGAVYIPYGDYRVTVPSGQRGLDVLSVIGFRMFGDSAWATRFRIDGANVNDFLNLDGVAHGDFSDFAIIGHTRAAGESVNQAIHLHWTRSTANGGMAASSTRVVKFRGIHITEMKYKHAFAVAVDNSSYQNDEIDFYGCKAAGDLKTDPDWWQAGYALGSGLAGNTFAINIYGLSSTTNRYAVLCKNASVNVFGGGIQNHEVDFKLEGLHRNAVIEGVRSETAKRFLHVGAGPGGQTPLVVLKGNVYYPNDLHGDNYFIFHEQGGILSIEDMVVGEGYAKLPLIRLSNANLAGLVCKVNGMVNTTAVDALISDANPGNQTPYIDNYVQINDSSALVARWLRYYRSMPAADMPNRTFFTDNTDVLLKYKDQAGVLRMARQAANPDTSGATLAALETEVNELKAALRAYGVIA